MDRRADADRGKSCEQRGVRRLEALLLRGGGRPLTLAAAQINTWNRIAIASRGQYDRAQFHKVAGVEKVTEPA
jgi:hypothetical protein